MTKRIEQVDSLIKRELSAIILREIDFPRDVLLTITRVETLVNLSEAKVYISVMPDKMIDGIFEILNKNIYHIQQCLNKRLNMRPIPKIVFKREEKTEEADRVEEILEGLKKE